jgi:hypothetical protein
LAELREPKTLGGNGEDAVARLEEIAERRRLREELPPLAHLDGPAAVQKLEQEVETQIAQQMAAHESACTAGLYDCCKDETRLMRSNGLEL